MIIDRKTLEHAKLSDQEICRFLVVFGNKPVNITEQLVLDSYEKYNFWNLGQLLDNLKFLKLKNYYNLLFLYYKEVKHEAQVEYEENVNNADKSDKSYYLLEKEEFNKFMLKVNSTWYEIVKEISLLFYEFGKTE